MIRLLVKLGVWLDRRFPVKVIVTETQYQQLHTEVSMLRSELKDMTDSLNKSLERLSVIELSAVHKEPVQLVIAELEKLKADYTSFKASMGFTPAHDVISALFNGESIK